MIVFKLFQRYLLKNNINYITNIKISHNIHSLGLEKSHHRKFPPFKIIFNRSIHSDNESDEEQQEEFLNGMHLKEDYKFLTYVLHPNITNDALLTKLNHSSSLQEIFELVEEYEEELTGIHLSQILLFLCNFQSIFYKIKSVNKLNSSDEEYFLKNPSHRDLLAHPTFNKILNIIDKTLNEYTTETLCCVILYLKKIGLNLRHPLQNKLYIKCIEMFSQNEESFSLSAISRLSVAVIKPNQFIGIFTMKDFMPQILKHLDLCKTLQDLWLITICLKRNSIFITKDILDKYKNISEKLIMDKKDCLNDEDCSIIVKVLSLLIHPQHKNQDRSTIKNILLTLKGNIEKLDSYDLNQLFQAFSYCVEPSSILNEIRMAAYKKLEYHQNEGIFDRNSIRLLTSLIILSSPTRKKYYESILVDQIKDTSTFLYLNFFDVYKTLRYLKSSNVKIYDGFWTTAIDILNQSKKDIQDFRYISLSTRYLYFNNNLIFVYRHYELERHILNWFRSELPEKQSWFSPNKMATVGAFLTAYGPSHEQFIDIENLFFRLVSMAGQYSLSDCLLLSRGIQISNDLYHPKSLSQTSITRYYGIEHIIKEQIQMAFSKDDLTLHDILTIGQIVVNIRKYRDYSFVQPIVHRMQQIFKQPEIKTQLNSHSVKKTAFLLNKFNIIIPEIMNQLCQYIIENADDLLGETVEKILFSCFYFNYYIGEKEEEFFKKSSQIIKRDMSRLSSQTLLKSCMALCYFNYLDNELIDHIFSVAFLEQIEDEIKYTYSKDHYPKKLQKDLMKLNRAICLDFPEADVPWFHEKYCQEIESQIPRPNSCFYNEVFNVLKEIVNSKDLIKQHTFSPYSYKIDFQINLDKSGTPVHFYQKNYDDITKVALILQDKNNFTFPYNSQNRLKGEQEMQKRHLEILGYLVIEVPVRTWNSMYMSEPGAKYQYLKNKIWQHFR